jgi:hypothetical protein
LASQFLQEWCEHPRVHHLLLTERALTKASEGNIEETVKLLDQLWLHHHNRDAIHRLMFRRGARPVERSHQLELFEAVADDPILPFHYRSYARIVMAYRAIDVMDMEGMARAADMIRETAHELEKDPETFNCRRANRFNRTKLLISCYTVLVRLLAYLGRFPEFSEICSASLDLYRRLNYEQLNRDVSYRMTTNLMRCLGSAALDAWCRADAISLEEARADVDAAEAYSQLSIHRRSRAQEDHTSFAEKMKAALAEIDLSNRDLLHAENLLVLIFKKKLTNKRIMSKIVLPGFREYASAVASPT